MANKLNPRRKGVKRAEHGPRWEGPETDRNSARSRKKWKRRVSRADRRTGTLSRKFHVSKKPAGAGSKEEQ